ncbi:MAG: hypothetical protein AAFY71_22965 [Bacteroidota bacterium]
MEFSHTDIKNLYGSVFFQVESPIGELDKLEEKIAVEVIEEEPNSPTLNEKVENAVPEEKEVVLDTSAPPQLKQENDPVAELSTKTVPPILDPHEQFLGTGPLATWKLKPNTELALIVLASEFAQRESMANLKNLIVNAGIDTSKIGFGIIEDGLEGWNFSDMPVAKGIIFASFGTKLPSPVIWKGKSFYPAAPMERILKDERYGLAMSKLLERVRETM